MIGLGNFSDCLLDDAQRLPHLLHAHHVPVVGVAVVSNGNFEIEVRIGGVGLRFAQVPLHAAGAQHRTGHAQGDALLAEIMPTSLVRSTQIRLVVSSSSYSSIFGATKFEELLNLALKAFVGLVGAAADAEGVGGQAGAAILLENLENLFPVAEGIEKRRDGADVERVRAQPQHVAGQAVQLGENHANVLGPARSFDIQQFFNRFAVAQAIRHRRHIVHAIHVGIEHGVGAVLGDLLHSAMEISDYALGAQNFFAIELENHAQHAVRGGVLRAHIDDELIGIEKSFLVLFKFQVGGPVRHCPLSIPRLI